MYFDYTKLIVILFIFWVHFLRAQHEEGHFNGDKKGFVLGMFIASVHQQTKILPSSIFASCKKIIFFSLFDP